MKKLVNIRIVSDVVCPWCYIGKRSLQEAMDLLKEEYQFEIEYLPFELSPDLPHEGMNHKEYVSTRYGEWEQYVKSIQRIEQVGENVGIHFQMKNILRTPNTFLLHRIIQFAHRVGLQIEIKEALFKAYFEELIDLTESKNIISVAASVGLNIEDLNAFLSIDETAEDVRTLEQNVRALGIYSVPYFIVNSTYLINGAVSSDRFISIIKKSVKEMERVPSKELYNPN